MRQLTAILLVSMTALALSSGCWDDQTDSETHWARATYACQQDSDCPNELSCLCGMCTTTCESDPNVCSGLANGATCVTDPVSREAICGAGVSLPDSLCAVDCNADTDCPTDQQCTNGFCEDPAGTTGGPDASSDTDTSDTGTGDTGSRDTNSSDTRDASPDADAAPPTDCSTTSQCNSRFGDNSYCGPLGTCLDATHADCDDIVYPPQLIRDDVVILGSIGSRRNLPYDYGPRGAAVANGVRFAVREYAQNAGALPGNQVVAHLHCEASTEAEAVAAAEHMQQLSVPVIVNGLASGPTLDMVQQVTGDSQDDPIVTLSTDAPSPAIPLLEAAGTYSFSLAVDDRFEAVAIADRLTALVQRSCTEVGAAECTDDSSCQAQFGADWVYDSSTPDAPCRDTDFKIAAFYNDSKSGMDRRTLTEFEIAEWSELDAAFYEYKSPRSLGWNTTSVQDEIDTVVSSAVSGPDATPNADAVLFLGEGESDLVFDTYVAQVDAAASLDPTTRQYLFSTDGTLVPGEVVAGSPNPAAYLPRVESIFPLIFNTADGLYEPWQFRYEQAVGQPAKTSLTGVAYDAAYIGLFSMSAASSAGFLDAPSVSQVLSSGRLQDAAGVRIPFRDPSSFPADGSAELDRGNSVDLIGVTGQLNFVFSNDSYTGYVRKDYMGVDVEQDGSGYVSVPARKYMLVSGQVDGNWVDL